MSSKSLDDVTTALVQVVEDLRGGGTPMKKRMSLEAFVTRTIKEIAKAAKDDPIAAAPRLAALKRSVDDVLVQVAKIAAEDSESEGVTVEVSTAFAPTKSAGDAPMGDLTTSEDQDVSEVALTSLGAATATTSFAERLEKIAKALENVQGALAATSERSRATGKRAGPAAAGEHTAPAEPTDGGDRDGWPTDLNSAGFLEDKDEATTELTWGADPTEVSAPGAR